MTDFDVLVIGSGAAGQTVAAACAREGRSVAVVDRLPFGGTCALRGCIPKKALLAGVEAASRFEGLVGEGIEGRCSIDWPALMARKERTVAGSTAGTLAWMHDAGITTLEGAARFIAEDAVEVDGERVSAEDIVIATGSTPASLGIDGEHLVSTSTDFLSLPAMPARVLFIGGGYISFEFARLAQLAGASVTIVHRSSRVLKEFDERLAMMVVERYRALGITVLLDAPVAGVEHADDGVLAVRTAGNTLVADAVFHGAGRVPALTDLALEVAGVAYDRAGVTVDATLRSVSNPRVWAAGDAAALGVPLTPVAGAHGEVVAAGILGAHATFDPRVIASVVFTDPPLAAVGMSATDAAGDPDLEVREFDMSEWFTQTRVGNTSAGATLVLDRTSGAVMGAHLLGVDADEVVNVFALAIRQGATLDVLKSMTWSYPTLSYDINYLTGRY